MTVEGYLHRGRQWVTKLRSDDRLRRLGRAAGTAGAGFLLSAAGLGHRPQPFSMALVSSRQGWRASVMMLGSMCGYLYFWNSGQGAIWSLLAGLTGLVLGKSRISREAPLLIPALCALWTAAAGLVFLFLGENPPTIIYLLRIALSAASAYLFRRLKDHRDPVLLWIGQGIGVLALAQAAPVPWLGLGYIAAGALTVWDGFPGAALAGLALDLARVTPAPMTAVLSAAWLIRLVPGLPVWLRRGAPGAVYLLTAPFLGSRDLLPLPGLLLGGFLSGLLPAKPQVSHRRGETGMAQVRLEMMAQVLTQTRLLLMEERDTPIDEEALLARTRERACGGCPNRRGCQVPERIPREYLRRPLVENTRLSFPCKKSGRMILELRRTQEQYRALRGDRDRQREYRRAVSQQYGFLADYLREQSDLLPRRGHRVRQRFAPEVAVAARSREAENGDRFRHFSGPGGRYFLLLCDGMGTGPGAANEGRDAAHLLQQMLTAGFPPEHALESLNSLLALRGRAGAVTVDLAELRLDTGGGALYKWGAVPSILLRRAGAEKIGTAGPPPGIRIGDVRAAADRLSLGRGEALIILSDGVDGEEVRRCGAIRPEGAAGELAAKLLAAGAAESEDDATVAVVRLRPLNLST